MKSLFALIGVLAVTESLAQQPITNPHLRIAERPADANGRPGFYSEVLKDGTNFVTSIVRNGTITDITIWFDQRRTLSIIDTNNDGRADQYCVSTDCIPQSVWLRNATNGLVPMDKRTLTEAQEFSRMMTSEFPKVVDSARKGNTNEFHSGLGALIQKAVETRSKQNAAQSLQTPQTGSSDHPR